VESPRLIAFLTMNSAKELEHFERIRQSFESTTTQEKPGSTVDQLASLTIGDAVDGLSPGSEITENGNHIMNGNSHEPDSKDKGKTGSNTVRGKGRNSSAVHAAGKGKSKTVVPSGGDSDSSFDGYQAGSRNGSTHVGEYEDLGEEADVDGVEDGDDDDYVIRTDHLKSDGTRHDDDID
jgi:peroxin-6